MVPKWMKIIRKSPYEESLMGIIEKILLGDLSDLDIKKIQGSYGKYRCRIGEIRIVFREKQDGGYEILQVGNRGDIYKNI